MTSPPTFTPDLADHRPDVYFENGTWIFRASSFGNCDAQLVRQAIGQTPADAPEWMQTAYRAGVSHEAKILDGVRKWGWHELDKDKCGDYGRVDDTGQLLLELRVAPNAVIRCHPDGIAQCWRHDDASPTSDLPRARRVMEAKALARSWSNPLGKPQYAWQVSVEMAATKLGGVFLVGWKDDCECVVENTAGEKVSRHQDCARCHGTLKQIGEVTAEWVDKPPFGLGEIKARARKLLTLIDDAERGVVPACTWAMYPCGFYPMHDTESGVWAKREEVEVSDEGRAELGVKIAEWKRVKGLAGRWNEKVEKLRGEVQAVMARECGEGEGDAGEVRVDGVKVEWHPAGTSKRLDQKLMRDKGLDPEDYKTESVVKAFVKLTEEKAT